MRVIGCMAVVLLVSARLFGQSERVIKAPDGNILTTFVKDPETSRMVPTELKGVEIEGMQVEGRAAFLGTPFPATDGWLRTFKVKLRNVSGKRVSAIRMTFALPDAKYGEAMSSFGFEYGRGLSSTPSSRADTFPVTFFEPDAETELGLDQAQYEHIVNAIGGRTGVTDYKTVLVGVTTVLFEDGTVWFAFKPQLKASTER
ncbi:MAG: hypothetical protein ACJ73D_08935 [Pyrinomonadaceae bacterium]